MSITGQGGRPSMKGSKVKKTVASARIRVGREDLLRAAAEVFFEQGYAATSIDAIIERAGGSERNIYSECGSKDGPFTALVAEHAEAGRSALSIGDPGTRDLRDRLMRVGVRLI